MRISNFGLLESPDEEVKTDKPLPRSNSWKDACFSRQQLPLNDDTWLAQDFLGKEWQATSEAHHWYCKVQLYPDVFNLIAY